METTDLENLPHYVYVIHSEIDDIVYYGMTCDPESRWKTHISSAKCGYADPLYAAMREHGAHRFTLTVLCGCTSRTEARKIETAYTERGRKVGNVYNRPSTGAITLTLPGFVRQMVEMYAKQCKESTYESIVSLLVDGHRHRFIAMREDSKRLEHT